MSGLPICPHCHTPMAEDARPGWRHLCTEGLAHGVQWREAPVSEPTEREQISALLDRLLADPQMQRIFTLIDTAGGPGNLTPERLGEIETELREMK